MIPQKKPKFNPPKPVHKLKWKIPESKLCAPLKDANLLIPQLKKLCKFIGGGEFVDVISAKEFGENVFAYFIVRTDKKTEEEQVLFEGYMLQEEDKLGFDVQSSFGFMEDLKKMGYRQVLSREINLWSFTLAGILPANTLRVRIYSIIDFGDFIEISIPATNFANQKTNMDKKASDLLAKIGVKKEEIIPTDVITLQILSQQEQK